MALYVVATPIGNLQDLSPRAIETLKSADVILAEDTRVTMKLCQVFDLHARLISCHRHNERERADALAEEIQRENWICSLVTDAGTPCISDPGNEVVRACVERGIPVLPVPGCCAGIAAVSISGFDAREFAFYGFLPREKKDLREKLRTIIEGPKVAILHESPFRIIELTETLAEIMPQAKLTVCCDLTKKHEKTLYGTPEAVLALLRNNEKTEKGEYCVVLDLHDIPRELPKEQQSPLSMEARLVETMKEGMSLRDAQNELILQGEKKNAVKHAALALKSMFSE